MSEKPVAQFSDQEMVEWANANLERVRELEAEVERLKREVDEREKLIVDNALLKEQVERLREALLHIKYASHTHHAVSMAEEALAAVQKDSDE